MKVVGIIAEYNPFHLGHKYHLEQSLKQTQGEFSIAIISGSFVQRGEPSFIDKWTKAKMAIDNGIDLVIELPFIFSTQSAEFFAYGGVKLLDSLNIVDYIAFGSETGELKPLFQLAEVFSNEPIPYRQYLQSYLSKGFSFSVSRSMAVQDYFKEHLRINNHNYEDILNQSNNILAIEYLKALIKLNSKIQPIPIKRMGSNYKDTNISGEFSSATAIRKQIESKGIESVKSILPNESYVHLENFYGEYGGFNNLENYNQILLYLFRTMDVTRLFEILDVEPGLENRIMQQGRKYSNIRDIIDNTVTKRYPRTRVQRIIIHMLMDLMEDDFMKLYNIFPSYIRILGANNKGLKLINKIKTHSNIPIITKFADYKKLHNKSLLEIIDIEKKATDLFYLGLNPDRALTNMDYFTSPYIK